MMTPERKARVWLWLAHFHELEGDSARYEWPPEEGLQDEAELSYERSSACLARADSILPGASDSRWRDAYDTFGDPTFEPGSAP